MFVTTYTNCKVDLITPDPSQIKLVDIAHSLARICRFNGHSTEYYSVAEHCVILAEQMLRDQHPVEACMAGLMHDAHEAYAGDITRPLKELLGSDCQQLLGRLDSAIKQKFLIDIQYYKESWQPYDNDLLMYEAGVFFGFENGWVKDCSMRWAPMRFWTPGQAEHRFLTLHAKLTHTLLVK